MADRVGVSGMKAAGDVGRSYEREKLIIVACALAQIGIKIDNQFHLKCDSIPRRNCSRSRSRSESARCASARETSRKRTKSLGRNCAAILRSTVITCASFG